MPQQMVLPQTPAELGLERSAGKASAGKASKTEDSRFDSVSQAERKRMDRRQSEAAEQSERPPEAPAREDADPPRETTTDGGVAEPSGTTTDREAASEDAEADATPVYVPITFAELQAALSASPGEDGTELPAAGQLPRVGLLAGTSSAGTGTTSSGATGQFLDAFLGTMAGNDSPRSADGTSPTGAGLRLQGNLDLTSQNATLTASQRTAAESAVPLRGYATSVDVPVGHAEWGDKLVGKLSWLTARNLSVAEIHLTPPDMGPLEVKVRVHNEQANITVHAANPVVRDQLELHSHRLRDMLGEQGLSLARFDVSDQPGNQSGGQSSGDGPGGEPAAAHTPGLDGVEPEQRAGHLDLSWNGEVDVFA
ncbi:hypothetical protein BTO32_01280 [Marinobacter lutaoensis]|uniref:Flagellar hook-length control protein-like C-terminal domain-containing protein n=1 Tax=Marinobacter lutaoensis TaxID=135739 RepID=A0A1V2DXM8_9GAMM|nr:flagellar hook-length control protein FliK [Marinobacter lutaoensis]ONF45136.1 hypothetical protein BTO32_01280 [Marinobacter lutaoensis]